MEDRISKKQNARLRRIDIGKWRSDVARQYGIRRLPTLWLYEGKNRITTDSQDVWARIQWMK